MDNNKPRAVYIDSSVLIAYINGEPGRVDVVGSFLDEVASNDGSRIFTSTISMTEVAYGAHEKQNGLIDTNTEAMINDFWSDPSITLVEYNFEIAQMAKDLLRSTITNGWKLCPYDGIHLATAWWLNKHVIKLFETFTYDKKLLKYGPILGIHISEPFLLQNRFLI